jgi:hypothetical protein
MTPATRRRESRGSVAIRVRGRGEHNRGDRHDRKSICSETYAVASLLGVVSSLTGGALAVNAKESDCTTPVTDFATHIVDADPVTAGVQELKQWQAVTSYFSKLPDADADGIPDVPASYGLAQFRIGAQ